MYKTRLQFDTPAMLDIRIPRFSGKMFVSMTKLSTVSYKVYWSQSPRFRTNGTKMMKSRQSNDPDLYQFWLVRSVHLAKQTAIILNKTTVTSKPSVATPFSVLIQL